MSQLNKEQGVFVAVLILFALLLFMRTRSFEVEEARKIRPKSVEETTWDEPDIRIVDRGDSIWSLERRDVFAVPREVEDLPPVAMPLPPIPVRPIVAPSLDPMPASGGWHRFAHEVPHSLKSGKVVDVDEMQLFLDDMRRRFDDIVRESPDADSTLLDAVSMVETISESIDDEEEIDLGEHPEAVDVLAMLFVAGGTRLDRILPDAPEVVQEMYTEVTGRTVAAEAEGEGDGEEDGDSGFDAASELRGTPGEGAVLAALTSDETEQTNPDELYDRVYRGSDVIYGKVLNDDPLTLLGEESVEAGRYDLVAGAEVRYAIVNERSGRRIGTATYDASQIDAIALADTLDNQIALRKRKLRDGVRSRVEFGRWCEEREAWDAAIEQYRAAMEAGSGFQPDAVFGLMSVLKKDYRWEELAGLIDDLRAQGIENGRLEYERGELLRRFGLLHEARAAFEECVTLEPGRGEAWLALGWVRYRLGAPGDALEAFKRAERALSADTARVAEAVAGQAWCLLGEGKSDEAMKVIDHGLRDVDADDLLLQLTRAKALASDGKLESAESVLGGISSDEGKRGVALVRGIIAARSGDYFEAKNALEEARDLDPVDAYWPTIGLGYLGLTTGRREAAFDAISQAVAMRPDDAYGRYLLGRFYLTTGNLELALAELGKANQLAPEVTEILGDLGMTHLMLGAPREARLYLSELARRRPDSAEAHSLLALALIAGRNYREARASVDRALQQADELPIALVAKAYLDYRDGGEGVYQAIGALDRTFELTSKVVGHPLGDYAAEYRRKIEENRSKCQWVDGFNRVQIKRDWDLNQRHGVQVRLQDNAIRFEGTQKTRDEELTYIEREMEFRQVMRLEARVRCDTNQKARAGVSILVRRSRGGDDVQGGILFGRDTRGNIAYRLVERNEAETWTVLEDHAWPGDDWVTLTIENHDQKEGLYRLLVNGTEVARDVAVRVLRKPRSPVRVGIFGTSGIGTNWSLDADDVSVVMVKEES